MDRLWHAHQARSLIGACGGLEAAAEVCRVGKTALGEYQSPHGTLAMPADVMADLEAYAGRPLYSRALAEALPEARIARDLMAMACGVTESTSDLQRSIRLAVEDGVVTPAERARLLARFEAAQAEMREVGALLGQAAA